MKKTTENRIAKRQAMQLGVVSLILGMGLAGCAGTGGGPAYTVQAEPQKLVAERAQARWDALIKRDFAQAYEYLSPGTRDKLSLDAYTNRIRGGSWKKAGVDSVSCEQDKCKVGVKLEYSYRDMKSIETVLDENWLLQDGKWWFVPRK